MLDIINYLQEEVKTFKTNLTNTTTKNGQRKRKTSVNIFGRMEHAPILERVSISSSMVTNMKPHSVTRWLESYIASNLSLGWNNNPKVHQNG